MKHKRQPLKKWLSLVCVVKFSNESRLIVERIISSADTCFAVIYSSSADTEFGTDFSLPHAVHIAIQYGEFQCGELQGVDKFVVFAVICLLLFKAVDRIHRQRLVIRKIYVFDCAASVGFCRRTDTESR